MKRWFATVPAAITLGLVVACNTDSPVPTAPSGSALTPRFAASGVAGATYTTNNPVVDGLGTCNNGNPAATDPTINCNIYDQKAYVWLTGGPTGGGSALEDGTYFFAVLDPGGQHNDVNDGQNSPVFGGNVNTNKNLSDEHDAYTNRTFTVAGGKIVSYSGSHTKYDADPGAGTDYMIRLMPYTDTPNPGGEYDMAICQIGLGYNPATEATAVTPAVCKYDNFKVRLAEPPPPEPDELIASIRISPTATNAIGEQHVFTVNATVTGGTTPYSVTITPSVAPAPGTYSSTCTGVAFSSSNNAFTCTITINSTTAGVFVANASIHVTDASTPTQTADDNTATGTGADGPATKTYVAATLSWLKTSDYPGGALAGATFKIERIADRFGVAISPSNPIITGITDCTANPCAGTDKDPAGGAFRVEGLQLGTWRITETAAPLNYDLASPVYQDVVINNLSSPTGSAAFPFVDPLHWYGETATGQGLPWYLTRRAPQNWFMYTQWSALSGGGTVNLIAGQHYDAGDITGTRGATANSTTLVITLSSAFRFAAGTNNVKINPMSCTTNQTYVQPGQFSVKRTALVSANSITVSGLANTDCYGIHVDVERNPILAP